MLLTSSSKLRNISFFAGIGGFDLGLERAGIETVAQVEIDDKCRNNVLARHFPNADRSVIDVREAHKWNLPGANVCTGGFPCQDLSVAGLRKGLAGERSGLYFEFHRFITETLPEWIVIENVPGLLSSNDGRDFAIVIGGLTGIIPAVPNGGWGSAGVARGPIYSVAYRILDAQYFGLAQRRRRVFVVASLGTGRSAQVLFEPEGGCWDTPPGREAGTGVAAATQSGIRGTFQNTGHGWWNESEIGQSIRTPEGSGSLEANLIAFGGNNCAGVIPVAPALNAHGGTGQIDFESEAFICELADGCITPWDAQTKRIHSANGKAPKLAGSDGQGGQRFPNFATSTGVRRLTPVECERLQGFPDGWTGNQSDSTRYRQLGNAVAVPVAEWIGKRIVKQAR